MKKYYLNYLDELESEAIFILREVWAQFQNPVLLFSGGKDSITMVAHLSTQSFLALQKSPFTLLHMSILDIISQKRLQFRDELVGKYNVQVDLIVGSGSENLSTRGSAS